ncbi:MAG TPA: PQQ-binding-like beta-propeller repeat protein, partial [Planctomycetota bacterium]|nr:PQQ-binding-like beta-propeller repeat protein [Planctomycetota bacterium]
PFTRSSPAVRDGRVYIGDEEGRMLGFDAASGKALWAGELGGTISTCPLVCDDGVLFASDQGDAALVTHDGAVRWKRPLGARLAGQPLATQTQAIVPTERGVLVLRRADGQPDPRLVLPESPGKVLSAVPCGDRLFLIAAQAEVDFRSPPRTYVTYEGAAIVWGPKPKVEAK